MSASGLHHPLSCTEVRPLLAQFWQETLAEDEAEQIREHLDKCEDCEEALCQYIADSVLRRETLLPRQLAELQPPPDAFTGYVAEHQRRVAMLVSAVEPSLQDQNPVEPAELDALRTGWQRAVHSWSVGPGVRTRGARGGDRGSDADAWPKHIDVPITSTADLDQKHQIRFTIDEPPTITPAGEFVATLRTDDEHCIGWSLSCTVSFTDTRQVTFTSVIHPDANGQGGQTFLHATDLPSETPLSADVIIPERSVRWALHENSPSQTEAVPGRAVLIGITHYTDAARYPPLRYSIRDIIGLYVMLTHAEHGRLAAEQVTLLLDGTDADVRRAVYTVLQRLTHDYGLTVRPGMVEEILEKRILPEREEILAALQSAVQTTRPDELLVCAFAGHGYADEDTIYVLPSRTRHPLYFWTAVSLEDVKALLRQSRAQETVFVLDADYGERGAEAAPSVSQEQRQDVLFANTDDVAFFASCMPGETRCEPTDGKEQAGQAVHSLFASFLLDGLLGRADLDSRGGVTLADLSRYVTDNVIAWWAVYGTTTQSDLQTPHVSATHAHQIVLSGNRRLVPERPTRADPPSLSAEAGLPLAVRVWMQAASAPCRSPSDGGAPQPRRADPAFVEGQAVRFGFWVSQDAYLYLLYVDAEGTVSLTFPRGVWQENHVGGKQLYFLPGETDDRPVPLPGPPGTGMLMAIATSQPVPMFTEGQLEDADALSASELMRWEHTLTGLPRGQWALGQFQFVIRMQE